MFVSADDPKSNDYSEDEGWQLISLGDQVPMQIRNCSIFIRRGFQNES